MAMSSHMGMVRRRGPGSYRVGVAQCDIPSSGKTQHVIIDCRILTIDCCCVPKINI